MPGRISGGAVVFALLVTASAYLTVGIRVGGERGDRPSFHIDEAHKLSEAYYFDLLFRRAEPDHPDWSDDFYARTNPPVAKYAFGAALLAADVPVRDRNLQDEFARLWTRPTELRALVPDSQLRVTRHVSAILGALTCAALAALAYRASGVGAALLTTLLVLGNKDFVATARRGLTDTALLFHLALIGPVTVLTLESLARRWRKVSDAQPTPARGALVALTVLLPGTTIALAAGSKLNGALTAPIHAIACSVAIWLGSDAGRPRRQHLAWMLAMLAATGLVSFGLFCGMNPFFHHDPLERALETLPVFGDWMLLQQIHPGEGLFSFGDRVQAFGEFLLGDRSAVRKLGMPGSWLLAFAVLLGIARLGSRSFGPRSEGRDPAIVALCWSLVLLVAVTAWLPVSWDRYFLPPFLAGSLLAGIGIAELPRSLRRSTGQALACAGAAALLVASGVLRVPDLEASAEVDSARSRRRLALALSERGDPAAALVQLESALAIVGADPGDDSPVAVQRCVLLNEIAMLHAQLGRRDAAVAALEAHVAVLERFRDRMATRDPYVLGGAQRRIEGRKAELARLREGS